MAGTHFWLLKSVGNDASRPNGSYVSWTFSSNFAISFIPNHFHSQPKEVADAVEKVILVRRRLILRYTQLYFPFQFLFINFITFNKWGSCDAFVDLQELVRHYHSLVLKVMTCFLKSIHAYMCLCGWKYFLTSSSVSLVDELKGKKIRTQKHK